MTSLTAGNTGSRVVQRVPHGKGSYGGRRARLSFERMCQPGVSSRERKAIALSLLFRRFTGSFDGPEGLEVLQGLERAVEKAYPFPMLKDGLSRQQMEAVERKVLKQRAGDIRTAFLGGLGGAIYWAELAVQLNRHLDPADTDRWVAESLLRSKADLPGQRYPSNEVLDIGGGAHLAWRTMDFFDPPAIDRTSFDGEHRWLEHELMRSVVTEGLFRSRDELLDDRQRTTQISPELWAFASDAHEEFKEHKLWLIAHGVERGTSPLNTLEESVSGLFCENIATNLQILNLWIQALLVDLPKTVSAGDREDFDSCVLSHGDVEALTLANMTELFEIPASGSHEKLREALGREPRGPIPQNTWVLRAVFHPKPRSGPAVTAHWMVQGMDLHAVENPRGCSGEVDLEGDSEHFQAVKTVWQALYASNGIQPKPRANLTQVAGFLSVMAMGTLLLREFPGRPQLGQRSLNRASLG